MINSMLGELGKNPKRSDSFFFTVLIYYHYKWQNYNFKNPGRAKNQSDCRIRYRALLEKIHTARN